MNKNTKEVKVYTYDRATLSDVEIVAPSLNQNQAMLQVQALRQAMRTQDTREIIEKLTNGNLKIKASQAPLILKATAEILKTKRNAVKTMDTKPLNQLENGIMTIERLQEIQNKFYRV